MRLLASSAVLGAVSLAMGACSPAAEEPAVAPPQEEIQSSTAPSVGGAAALPTDGGVTPAPEAIEDATAADVAAAVSPERAAELSGGQQTPAN
ncbi:hypothetical protein [Brevundimonas variabilis]|uniref:Uncharacterized protein n=1 Tax=Brevundimonas variabilis TaxID=74312 RepID=A0A7W9CJZ3_9CAUL|nr:hypothetical protein [Brevundimonas variabilis]MBB5746941.1 hypothetical protein [Brevundimonas variabilis]